MKNVVIVNCFDTYEERVDLLCKYFKSRKLDCKVVQSNFRHSNKQKRYKIKENFIFVDTKPYYRNMSMSRMISHYKFAKDVFIEVQKIKPDIIYILFPPNSLVKFAYKYKRKYSSTKVYLDVIDLWPETMPINSFEKLPPFKYWKGLRNRYLKYADKVILECKLYKNFLYDYIDSNRMEILHLAKDKIDLDINCNLDSDKLNLIYLGSINNIIDIDIIESIVYNANKYKDIVVHIVGDGENREKFIQRLTSIGISVEYYGKVYDVYQKMEIFNKCHFAINIMKESVCVGLTMKSIDYFQYGIPIINNIKGDTYELVEVNNIGININNKSLDEVAKLITDMDNNLIINMKKNVVDLFTKEFCYESFSNKLDMIIEEI